MLDAIEDYAHDYRLSAAEIHRRLMTRSDLEGLVPVERTVSNIVKEIRAQTGGGPWVLSPNAPPGAALAVLEVLDDLWLSTSRRYPLSRRQADWIMFVAAVAPGIQPVDRFRLAVRLSRLEGRDLDPSERSMLSALELFLTSRAWESLELLEAYERRTEFLGLLPFRPWGTRGIAPPEGSDDQDVADEEQAIPPDRSERSTSRSRRSNKKEHG